MWIYDFREECTPGMILIFNSNCCLLFSGLFLHCLLFGRSAALQVMMSRVWLARDRTDPPLQVSGTIPGVRVYYEMLYPALS